MKTKTIFLVFAAVTLFSATASLACPGCVAALRDLGRAFNPSVLFMMAMPFTVVGAIAGGLVFAYRRAQRNADEIAEHEQAEQSLSNEHNRSTFEKKTQ